MHRCCEAVINVRGGNTDYWLVVSMHNVCCFWFMTCLSHLLNHEIHNCFTVGTQDFWSAVTCNKILFCWTEEAFFPILGPASSSDAPHRVTTVQYSIQCITIMTIVLAPWGTPKTLHCRQECLRGISSPLWLQVNHRSTEQQTVF